MRILVTHPGKFGDLLWALPTVRAISEAAGEMVDFLVSGRYSGILGLVREQAYVNLGFVDDSWQVQDTAPMTPRCPTSEWGYGNYDRVVHLGYRRWPQLPLAMEAFWTALEELRGLDPMPLSMAPWVRAHPEPRRKIVVGFTDEWAELKAGLLWALLRRFRGDILVLCPPVYQSRLAQEFEIAPMYPANWEHTAEVIAGAEVFVGCLSSQAVLAAGLGKKRVLMEPNPHRYHEIFQHWDTPLVKGNDGKPTFDARALVAAVEEKLS